jgi:NAD(P)-dependent dehydrogenase (short-subunit alcohol dehydrogenase family)
MIELRGTILVQGASRGIGLAMVRNLLAREAVDRVVATSRTPGNSDDLQKLGGEAGSRLRLLPLDVAEEDSIAEAAQMLRHEVHRLKGLINTAGILHDAESGMRPEKRVEALDAAHLERSFRINAFGPMLMAKHFLPLLRHDQPAFFASLSARVGSIEDNHLGGWYGYRASKAAQNQFTRTFAVEAARRARNLRVLALHPGTTDTDLSAPFQRNVPEGKLFSPEFVAERLLSVIENTDTNDSGSFLDWDHQPIPW